MNSNEAKEILLRYRPGTSDAEEPEVKSALDLASRDTELAAWLKSHLEFQETVRSRLRNVPVPVNLRQQILVGRGITPSIFGLRSPSLWAAAAAIVVLLSLGLWWVSPREDVTFTGFRERMVSTVLRNYPIQFLTNELSEIRRHLSERQVHGDYQLTRRLEQVRGYGCSVLSWQNHQVAMVCFEPAPGEQLYLFVADLSDIPSAPASATPIFQRVNRLTTAAWTSRGKLYVLAGEGEIEALAKYLD